MASFKEKAPLFLLLFIISSELLLPPSSIQQEMELGAMIQKQGCPSYPGKKLFARGELWFNITTNIFSDRITQAKNNNPFSLYAVPKLDGIFGASEQKKGVGNRHQDFA